MIRLLLKLVLLLFLWLPLSVYSQHNTDDSGLVSEQNLKELLETLESDSARQVFIDNLKTLIELKSSTQGQDNQEDSETLSEKLGIAEQTESVMVLYRDLLSRYNIKRSTAGKIILSTIAVSLYLFFILLFRKIVHALGLQVGQLRQRYGIIHQRFGLYMRIFLIVGTWILAILFVYTLNVIWDIADVSRVIAEVASFFMNETLEILAVVAFGVLLFEVVNGVIEYSIRRANAGSSNRIKTLLPIVRNVVFMVFTIFFTLVVLSELGIDIMPLLAGAGILGIAIGFGAQTAVKDFLTGFTIILEDLIQVGDVVSLAGRTGLVERITIRKVQLRDFEGRVYTVPFSEISIVENLSKDYSCYVFDVGVAYRENPDEVIKLLHDCDEELRSDTVMCTNILGPLEVFGIDSFSESAVVIKARYRTRPLKQWDVGRAFNRIMKMKFDEHGIEIPFPHRTLYFGEDKQGLAPSASIRVQTGMQPE